MLSGLASVWVGSYGAIAVAFVINVLLTRTLGPERFGHLALMLAVSQLLSVGPNASLPALVRFAAAEFALQHAVRRSFWERMTVVLPWYAGAALIAFLGAPWLSVYLGVPSWVLVLLLAYLVAGTLFQSAAALLRAIGRMRSYGLAIAGERVFALVALFILSGTLLLDPTAVVAVFSGTTMLMSLIILAVLGYAGILRFGLSGKGSRDVWRFSLPLLASNWLGVFGTQWIDYLIIRGYLPLAELGLYAVAYQVASAVQQLAVAVGTFLLPTYSRLLATQRDEDVRGLLQRLLPYWLLAFAILLCVAVAAADLVVLVFGPAFSGAVGPLRVLLVTAILLAIFNTFATVLIAYEANWPLAFVVGLANAVNVVLTVVLTPPLGITGAALATLTADAVSVVLILWIAGRRLRIPTLPYVLFFAPVAVAGSAWSLAPWPQSVAAVAAVVALAIAAARAFGLPSRRDVLLLRDIGAMR